MEAVALPKPKSGERLYLTQSGSVMILHSRDYSADQLWLDFVGPICFVESPWRPEEAPVITGRSKIYKPYAKLSDEYRYPYVYETGVDQHVLPFAEFKQLTGGQFKRLTQARFPAWDKTDTAKPTCHSLVVDSISQSTRDWCLEHLVGQFCIKKKTIWFQYYIDFVAAKLALS